MSFQWTIICIYLVLRDKRLSLIIGTSTKARFTICHIARSGLAALPRRDDRIHFYPCGMVRQSPTLVGSISNTS